MSFTFQLVREDEDSPRATVFEDSSTPGLVPVWEAAGVYDALYNSDGQLARDVSRRLAYGVDRLNDDRRGACGTMRAFLWTFVYRSKYGTD